MEPLPVTEEEIDGFIAAFEQGTLPKARWTHGAHVLTGACYVYALGEEEATAKMRLCVSRYNEAVGGRNTPTSGYHETITVFWIKVLSELRRQSGALRRCEFAAEAVARFAQTRRLHEKFYDFDVTGSQDARQRWIPPSRPIDLANL